MVSGNLTNEIFSSTGIYVPSIILDSIGISLCIIAICQTLLFILLILFRFQLIKAKEKCPFLLSSNMYLSIFVFALFILDMFISMLIGHLHPDMPQMINDTLWCQLKVYFSTIALICSLYSNTLQGFHRFLRIIFYTRPFFHQNIYLYIVVIFIQIFISALQSLLILLLGEYQYIDYHCQISLTNWRGMILAAFLIWLSPVSITIIIYAYTIRYIRNNSSRFTFQQQTRIKRDLIVIRRIVWLVMFLVIFGIPACSTTIIYYLFDYIGWWANHLTWSTFVLSFIGMSIVQTCYSPHLRILWSKRRNHIGPTTVIMRINTK